jgi:hypothetical protein
LLVPEFALVAVAAPATDEALAVPAVLAVAAALVVPAVLAVAAALAVELVPVAAWVSACSKLANTVTPWSCPSPDDSLPPCPPWPPYPPCRCAAFVPAPYRAASVAGVETAMALVDIMSSVLGLEMHLCRPIRPNL